MLAKLDAPDPRLAKVVEFRVFGGVEVTEVAEALDVSTATVTRDWVIVRAWLRREIAG